jgi:hypothetical protein
MRARALGALENGGALMALHDFWCQVCGQVLVDVNVPIAIGARSGAPLHCDRQTSWIPQVGRMDGANGPGFQAFEAHDGQNRPVLVDSLKKMRDIERQSEIDARNGEGQQINWRRWSNDRSNVHSHSLAPGWTGGAQPDPSFVRKHGASIRKTADDPNLEYGPGVSDDTPLATSHLKD